MTDITAPTSEATRTCSRCHQTKPVSAFSPRERRCRECEAARTRARLAGGTAMAAAASEPLDTSSLRYDYEQIDAEQRDQVRAAALDILAHGRRAKESVVAMGQRLIEVKAMLPAWTFTAWLTTEFELSERMAQNLMNVARQYGERPEIISVLNDTVLYLLAAPSTSDEVREKVEQAAASGQKVTVEFAKEVKRKHAPEPEPSYAPVWVLESEVRLWLKTGPFHDPDIILDTIRTGKSSYSYDKLEKYLSEREIVYRKPDLVQAINNVREQRRQAAAQAKARAMYVVPEHTENERSEEEQAAVAEVAQERIEEEAELVAHGALMNRSASVDAPIAEEQAAIAVPADTDMLHLTIIRSMVRKLHVALLRGTRLKDMFTGEEMDQLNIILSHVLK